MNRDEAVERAAQARYVRSATSVSWDRAPAGTRAAFLYETRLDLDASGYPAALEAAEQRAETLAAALMRSPASLMHFRDALGVIDAALADRERGTS